MDLIADARWIELEGAANVRDLGGLPTGDGGAVVPNRLIRSDNLQGLTPSDVRLLVDVHEVRAVADLRTEVEVESEGPGPMTREARVTIHHLSLFPEAGRNTDAAAADEDDDAPVVLPWQARDAEPGARTRTASEVYLRYLADRPDSIVAALRVIASSDGATVVHCAAGKDRTGVVVAMALEEVGVPREAVVADYARSAERIRAIFARLTGSHTYAADVGQKDVDKHSPKAATMENLLRAVDESYGGVSSWLRTHGWTEHDARALRGKLLG